MRVSRKGDDLAVGVQPDIEEIMANRGAVVPSFDQLLNPTLAALHTLGGSASIEELVERVIGDLRLSPEVIEQPHVGHATTELRYRLAWARTYLKKAGLIENSPRAVWSLTPKGRETKLVEPQDVVKTVRAIVVAERKAKQQVAIEESPDDIDDEADAPTSWRERLLERLLAMPPASFERLCMRVLRESGFIARASATTTATALTG